MKISFPQLHLLCAWAPSQFWHRPMVCFDATSLLPGQSLLPSQAQKSRRKFKSSPALSPTAAFHAMLVHDLNLASWFMFVTTKAAEQISWDHEKLKMTLQGVFRNVHIYSLWTSAPLLSITAYSEGIQKKTSEKEWHTCAMCECPPNAEVVS